VFGNIGLRRPAAADEFGDRLFSGGERLQQAQAQWVTQEPEPLGDQFERLTLQRMAGVRYRDSRTGLDGPAFHNYILL